MGAITVADEFLFPVSLQRFFVLSHGRDRQRRLAPDVATTSVSGLDIERKSN